MRSVGRTSGSVGRTAVLYEIVPESGYAVGIDLGGTKVTASIADLSCRVLAEITEATDPRGGTAVLDQILRLVTKLARRGGTHPSLIRSVALGTPGGVSPRTGTIELAPNIADLGQLDVVGILQEKLGGQVTIENDVNLALVGEIWHGSAQGVENVAFIALGTGIGLGLSMNGRLVRGENGAAGEIGYMPLGGDPLRPETRQQGCLEYEAGAAGILRRYRDAGGKAGNVREVFDRADAGEAAAGDVIAATAYLVALAAATVAATFDPALIVLGGSIGAHPGFAGQVKAALDNLTPRQVEIRASALGNRAGVVGAIAEALNRLHTSLFGLPSLPGDLALPSPNILRAEAVA